MRTRPLVFGVPTLALAALSFTVTATPAAAGELAGVRMPDRTSAGGEELVLNGMALRTRFFIKVYVAGLYLPEKSGSAEAVLAADGPRHLTMKFLRAVGKDSICDAWTDGLAANTPSAPAELKEQFETLCGWMADVEEGGSMTFTYQPGEGTTVTVEGADRGILEGRAFADALFKCWIGPEPGPGEEFKQGLMGG